MKINENPKIDVDLPDLLQANDNKLFIILQCTRTENDLFKIISFFFQKTNSLLQLKPCPKIL